MSTLSKLPSGRWRVQIRRRGQSVSQTFLLKADAERWARREELRIENGESLPSPLEPGRQQTLGDLVDLHLKDMADVGKAFQRSKEGTLQRLKKEIGALRLSHITRERLVEFGRGRAKAGAGPATVSMDLSFIHTVFQHAAVVYGFEVPLEQLRLGRAAWEKGLVPNPDDWNQFCEMRNTTAHTYDIAKAVAIFDGLPVFVDAVRHLVSKVEDHADAS